MLLSLSGTPSRAAVAIAMMICVITGAERPAASQPADATLRYDWKVDGALTAIGGLGWVMSEAVFKHRLAPSTCRWCDLDLNPLDASVRRALRWDNIDAGNTGSAITGFALAPAAALGLTALAARHDGRLGEWGPDALVILESTVLAVDLNQIAKFSIGRQRPLVRDGKAYPADDANVSFFSGHTTFAFALAVSSGTVASMRGYRWAPIVWGSGLALAGATGYLRIAGDRHYLTDVVVGAAVGSLVGVGVPLLFHRSRHDAAGPTAALTPAAMSVAWRWVW
jgi:hypothetical protein